MSLGGTTAAILLSGRGGKREGEVGTCLGLAPAKSRGVATIGISPVSPKVTVWAESVSSLSLAFSSSHTICVLANKTLRVDSLALRMITEGAYSSLRMSPVLLKGHKNTTFIFYKNFRQGLSLFLQE